MRFIFPKEPLFEYYKWLCKQVDESGGVEGLGVYSFIIPPDKTLEYLNLSKQYGRENLALKVFTNPITELEDFVWGNGLNNSTTKLTDCIKMQNLVAWEGLAPRVYDIVSVPFRHQRCYALVTDWATSVKNFESDEIDVLSEIREYLKSYGCGLSTIDPNESRRANMQYVDFQTFRIENPDQFKEKIVGDIHQYETWGARSDIPYQDVEEMGVQGHRPTQERIETLRMDDMDFRGKTVLDIGCGGGAFCRYASRKGASRVVGIDIGKVPRVAHDISIYCGMHNIDYYSHQFGRNEREDYKTICNMTGLDSFDIVLFLSVNAQIGYPIKYMGELCKETLFLEGHSADKEETYRKTLEQDFSVVEFTGIMRNNSRPAFLCLK